MISNSVQMFKPLALLFTNVPPQSKNKNKKQKQKTKRNAIAVMAVIEGYPVIQKY